jgi:hypothetical protein
MVASGRSALQPGRIHSEESLRFSGSRRSIERGLDGSGVSMDRRACGLLEEMENLLPLPGIKPRFFVLFFFIITTPTAVSHISLKVLSNSLQDANTHCSTYTYDVQISDPPLIPLLA